MKTNYISIILSFFISFLFAILYIRVGFYSVFVLPLILVSIFSFRNPKTAFYLYLFMLPFVPFYLGTKLFFLGTVHGVRLLNIVFLSPVIIRYFLLDVKIARFSKSYLFYDVFVVIFFIFSSFYLVFKYGPIPSKILYQFTDYFPIYFVITRYIKNRQEYVDAIKILIGSGCLLCIIGLLDYCTSLKIYTNFINTKFPQLVVSQIGSGEVFRLSMSRMQISFGQPLSLGIFICVLHALIVCNYDRSLRLFWKCIFISSFFFALICLVLSQSRGPLLVDILLLCTVLVVRHKIKLLILILAVILSFSAIYGSFKAIHTPKIIKEIWYSNSKKLENIEYRIGLYEDIVANINKVSLLGEHEDLFGSLQNRFKQDTVVWYFQILMSSGIITFVVFAIFIINILVKGVVLLRSNKELFVMGWWYALFVSLLCFFGISFVGQVTYIFWIVISICISTIVNVEKK